MYLPTNSANARFILFRRSHLNEIRDRSVLRLYESADVAGGSLPAGLSAQSHMWADQDQSYFSEPEFDSEFQHQHIHKTKASISLELSWIARAF